MAFSFRPTILCWILHLNRAGFVVRASRPHFFDIRGLVRAGRLHHKKERYSSVRDDIPGQRAVGKSEIRNPKFLIPNS